MSKNYYPILRAKSAEFKALSQASSTVKDNILPLFEISKRPQDSKRYKDSPHPKILYLNDICTKITEMWSGREVLFDTYHWQNPAETIETGEHSLSYLYNTLRRDNVLAIPVIGYDRWEIPEYRLALKSIVDIHDGKFSIRLDHFAIEDANEPEHFQDILSGILEELGLSPQNCHVIIDFADVSAKSVPDLISEFDILFNNLRHFGFMSYSIAGCSLPSSIDKAVKQTNSTGLVLRKEMLLWKGVRDQFPNSSVFFGDYGVRGPNTSEIAYGNTNAKIRYTTDNHFFIIRGQKIRKPIGGMQHCSLSDKLIKSKHYKGAAYSWGDSKITECSKGKFGGGATQWIEIDTSHHLAYISEEIELFERMREAKVTNIIDPVKA